VQIKSINMQVNTLGDKFKIQLNPGMRQLIRIEPIDPNQTTEYQVGQAITLKKL